METHSPVAEVSTSAADLGGGDQEARWTGVAAEGVDRLVYEPSPPTVLRRARVGHVRLERRLGRGGMGEVWEGFDEALHRRVAVKAIHQQRRSLPGGRERFLREARILSQLDHPNICRVYELIEGEDADFLILELVAGESLEAAARRGLADEQKLALAEQIARALAVAHQRRIVHRDLQPDNVMVTADGTVKVLDFGVARLAAADGDDEPSGPAPAAPMGKAGERAELPGTLDLRPPRRLRQSGEADAEVGLGGSRAGGAAALHADGKGEVEAAEALTREALALARQLGDRRSEAFSLTALGYFGSRRGRLPEADERLRSASALAREIDDRELAWLLARNVAYLRILQGRLDAARGALDQALAIKRDGLTLLVEARLAYARGELALAVALYEEARDRQDLPWGEWREGVLSTYRQAASLGRALPLPDEAAGE